MTKWGKPERSWRTSKHFEGNTLLIMLSRPDEGRKVPKIPRAVAQVRELIVHARSFAGLRRTQDDDIEQMSSSFTAGLVTQDSVRAWRMK